ncbi:spliceosome assembly protein PRP11 ASCRUDRAFT_77175 [Ascoidea rubescens DSM 1968]|uniref:U1-type domain-containing protein n=1 Tax=Ascoidea rubescens DSM 1968 TaxID=1344418 RepID=A0A1D2VCV0_9ASCO|nr:hypothetical protein ASCRUDRAFT_77175 [Ascoidea rubescens DSM 1968]ODV59439.1 hypothetical protein ASCRUDRAFT_77175 [Ascoidea rubescens DSM 1968]
MDYQNRVGSKKGSGGVATASEENAHRRERVRQLMSNRIDVDSDPYVFRNHLGLLECKLCLTTHVSEGSFLNHTQGKKHQTNLQRRANQDPKFSHVDLVNAAIKYKSKSGLGNNLLSYSTVPKKSFAKIGKPAYKITKIRDPISYEIGLLFTIQFPKLKNDIAPKYRMMSCFEQQVDLPISKEYQYLVVSGEPYENIGFKIPSKEIDKDEDKFWSFFDKDTKEFFIQFFFKNKSD